MRITRLHLSHFKSHEELEIEPAAGLTVIRGPNEAGKSTIQQALELVLFRKADSNREDIRRTWAWGSAAPPEVELGFELEGKPGTLRKRFGGDRSEGELTLGGQTIRDYTLIDEEVAEFIGVPTEDFYRATASVGHRELDAVAGDQPAIADRLQKAISGADRGTAIAKKKLETAIQRYRTEGHKNPGLLKVVREETALLEAELANGERALTRLQADRAQWVEAHERREELDVQLTRQQADLAEAQRAGSLAERGAAAQARYDRLKRAAELTEQGDRLQGELPSRVPLPQLSSIVSRAHSLEFELSELEAEISTVAEAAAAEGPDLVPPRPMRALAIAAILVVLGWLSMLLFRDAGMLGIIVVTAIGVGVGLTLVRAVRLAGRRRQYGLAMRLAASAVSRRQEQERSQQEQFRRKRRELDSMLAPLGVADVAAAEALLASAQQQTEVLAQIEGEMRGLGLDEHNLRRLEEARDQAAHEAEQAGHALAAMGRLAEDPAAALAAAQRQVAQTAPARDASRSEEDQAQGRIDANPVDAELVAELAERLAAAHERGADLQQRLLVYQGTLAAIEAAEQATLKTAARYLEERMGPSISAVTDGRYDDIEVDEKSLAFRVRVPETGELVEVAQLSQGTADQLFLAARLGLVRLVTLERRPPLILDDAFVTFDAARGERALRLVRQFAREHGFQVLYLTCSDRFDALADELVLLPGPSAERVLAMPRKPRRERSTGEADEPGPTLHFEPDPRPNPDPVAPRRAEAEGETAEGETAEDPLVSLRQAAKVATEAQRDTGVADPFRLEHDAANGTSD